MQAEILVAMFHSCRIERMSVRLRHLTPAEVHREPPTPPPAHPFGLWSVRFPPALVRTARRLPVEALCESGVLVSLAGYPRGGAPGPGAVPWLPEIKEKSGIWNLVPAG